MLDTNIDKELMKDINSATDNKDWLEIPTGPTGVRPSNPVAGQMRFDTTQSVLEYYNPSITGWRSVTNAGADATYVTATGGTVETDGDYKVHIFTSAADFIVTDNGDANGSNSIQILIVAGGGSGGGGSTASAINYERGAGGGAGGLRQFAAFSPAVTTYAIVIGAGASGASDGNASSGFGYSTTGGGAGGYHGIGSYPATVNGRAGGSGGGGATTTSAYAAGEGAKGLGNVGNYTPVEGYDGGESTGYAGRGGGGGGAGGVGQDDISGSGGGGAGVASSITGGSVTYASGGDVATAVAGGANTGEGGSGNLANTNGFINGGSGIVIIRYKFQN